jgi:hypothetical protein
VLDCRIDCDVGVVLRIVVADDPDPNHAALSSIIPSAGEQVGKPKASPERINALEQPISPPVPDHSEFVSSRRYFQNVTPKTLIWYNDAFSHFHSCSTEQEYKAKDHPTEGEGHQSNQYQLVATCHKRFPALAGISQPQVQPSL